MVATLVAVETEAATVEEAAVAAMTAEVVAMVEAVDSVAEEEEDLLVVPVLKMHLCNLRSVSKKILFLLR